MQGAPEKSGAPCFVLRRQGGFTLVELMVVVAIIGILAMIAVPNFLKMRSKAKTAEAKANLGAISITEHVYYTENSLFVGNQAYTPDRLSNPPGRFAWVSTTRFSILGFAPEGGVLFSYSLVGADFHPDNFTAQATSDLDGNNAWSVWAISGGNKGLTHSGAEF